MKTNPTPTHSPTETERPYTDTVVFTGLGKYKMKRTYNYPGGREALIERAVAWRGFTREEAEKQYPEEIL